MAKDWALHPDEDDYEDENDEEERRVYWSNPPVDLFGRDRDSFPI